MALVTLADNVSADCVFRAKCSSDSEQKVLQEVTLIADSLIDIVL